jgi:molybdopterin-guanine dinucleotide biosynthesis protein
MLTNYFHSSVTRIADFKDREFSLEPIPRERWRTGDYVAGEVVQSGGLKQIELTSGRIATFGEKDVLIGAFGKRSATLEVVGDWRAIDDDLRFEALTAACVFGKCTAKNTLIPPLASLDYRGHVSVGGKLMRMRDCAQPQPAGTAATPVILILGTSMDAGKTTTASVVIRLLRARGLRVGGVKFTGIGRYRDILAMRDAGADTICDFVDAGLPSTSCPGSEFEFSIDYLLARLAAGGIDVIVAEAGASPLEPYNGDIVVHRLRNLTRCTILCASDPYAVVGVTSSFNVQPNLIAGRATSTSAAVELTEKLCGIKAINVLDPSNWPQLDRTLAESLEN